MSSRLFGYNSGAPISGASQSGNLAISNDFKAGGSIQWWNGPNEDLGYVIGYPDTTGNRKANGSLIEGNSVGFVRTSTKTDVEFLSLANSLTGQNFLTASTATNWLNTNGYYTSYTEPVVTSSLTLSWDDITNADLLVGDSSQVSNWNTFFDLPTNGTPFTSVTIGARDSGVGNNVELYGGSNINLKDYLFSPSGVGNTNLLSVVDTANCITTAGDACFNSCASVTTFDLPQLGTAGINCFNSCASVTTFDLPQLGTAGINCFAYCTSVTTFDLPQLGTAGEGCFTGCVAVTTFDLPQLVTAGRNCFSYCTSVTTFDLPQLTTAGTYCFQACSSVTTFDLPQLVTAGTGCFAYCTSVTYFNLPLCTDLGATVGDDSVFLDITGIGITLIIHGSLMTCNSGDPDGDILYLQANTTGLVILYDIGGS